MRSRRRPSRGSTSWTVDVRANYGKVYPCRIRRLVGGRLLVLEARPPGLLVTQTYEVEGNTLGAHVRHAIEVSGRLSGLLRLGGAPWLYRRLLDREVEKVIRLAADPGTTTDRQEKAPR